MTKITNADPVSEDGSLMNTEDEAVQARRNFLKKAGKFAVYTPPAVMMLMKPGYATINASSVGRPRVRPNPENAPPPSGDPRDGLF